MSKKYIGVEIGGTKQQIAVGSADGIILESREVRLQGATTATAICDWIKENIADILRHEAIRGIGVGFGGPLEFATGRVLCSLQVEGWKDFELKSWFEEQFGLPVTVVNDTVAGGIAELKCGQGQNCDRFFYTNIGTGIGGGLYVDGRYYDGSGFGAGYLGNTWVPDWTRDSAGAVPGSATRLELICSGKHIETRLNRAGYVPEDSLMKKMDCEKWTCIDLAEAVKAGDAFAAGELDRIAETFSIGLANVLALTGVTRIAVGGGVAKMGEILFERIRKYTAQYAFVSNVNRYEIVKSEWMDDAVLVGALLVAGNKKHKNNLTFIT